MLVLLEKRPAILQALGIGQLTEDITQRAFENYEITMAYSHAGGSGPLPVTLQKKPGGFFALQLPPERAMPDFSARADVTLTATIAIQGRAAIDVAQTIPGTSLALTDTTASVAGTSVTYRRISGAPFDFSTQIAPRAVALQGVILRDHDPANPVSDVSVTTTPAASGGAVTSDVDGIFFIPVLPIAEVITLNLDEDGTMTNVPFRPDYARPVNTLTASLATPSP
jgi:hypothetical protein